MYPSGPLGPVTGPMWAWEVLPRLSSLPMIATGISSDRAKAARDVEHVLLGDDDLAAYGLLIGPEGHEICMRTRTGGCRWKPLWPEDDAHGADVFPIRSAR